MWTRSRNGSPPRPPWGWRAAATRLPLSLPLVGKTLLHAALVGGLAGVAGGAFFAALEGGQVLLLERLAGYLPLRAHGEVLFGGEQPPGALRPWLLCLLPALGGLASGLLALLAPEIAGGGGDATIHA